MGRWDYISNSNKLKSVSVIVVILIFPKNWKVKVQSECNRELQECNPKLQYCHGANPTTPLPLHPAKRFNSKRHNYTLFIARGQEILFKTIEECKRKCNYRVINFKKDWKVHVIPLTSRVIQPKGPRCTKNTTRSKFATRSEPCAETIFLGITDVFPLKEGSAA